MLLSKNTKTVSVENKPTFVASCAVELAKEDRGLGHSIIRLNTARIDQSRQDKSCFFRREAVRIYNPKNRQFIIRMPMGGGGLKGLSLNCVALDYEAINALGVKGSLKDGVLSTKLIISRAGFFSIYRYYWNFPDIGYQVALRLGMVSFVIGLLGAIFGVAGMF